MIRNPGTRTERLSIPEGETLDTFYKGRIFILQSGAGYRFSLDAPLLADFIRTEPDDELLDLGAGSGVVSLLLSVKPFAAATLVEIQNTLAALARRNVALNGLGKKMAVVRCDLRNFRPRKTYDVIYSNPPYIRKTTGFLSASEEKSVAKHEIKCDILEVMRATSRLLRKDGRAYFVFPALRRDDLERAAEAAGLHLRRLRFVRPRKADDARLFLAELGFAPGKAAVLPPLILRDARGRDTAAARRIYEGGGRGRAF